MSARPLSWPVLGLLAAALAALVGLAVTAGQNRAAVLSELQRPAGVQTTTWVVDRGTYRLRVELSPNRAGYPNHLLLSLTDGGRRSQIDSARVTFSMPAMNMWNVFTSSLRHTRTGAYIADEPVLGMAGRWRLSFTLAVGGRRLGYAVVDRMSS